MEFLVAAIRCRPPDASDSHLSTAITGNRHFTFATHPCDFSEIKVGVGAIWPKLYTIQQLNSGIC